MEEHQRINREIFESHSAILRAVIKGDPDEADRCVDEMVRLFRGYIS